MDLRMPEVEGVVAIGAICATTKSARIIVLTTMIVTKISIEDCAGAKDIC